MIEHDALLSLSLGRLSTMLDISVSLRRPVAIIDEACKKIEVLRSKVRELESRERLEPYGGDDDLYASCSWLATLIGLRSIRHQPSRVIDAAYETILGLREQIDELEAEIRWLELRLDAGGLGCEGDI